MADTPPGKAPDTARAQLIRQAQTFIAQNSAQTVDFAALAARSASPRSPTACASVARG